MDTIKDLETLKSIARNGLYSSDKDCMKYSNEHKDSAGREYEASDKTRQLFLQLTKSRALWHFYSELSGKLGKLEKELKEELILIAETEEKYNV